MIQQNKETKTMPVPMDRTLFFPKQVDQTTIGELTEKIIRINEDDSRLEKFYNPYDIPYKRMPILVYIDSYGGWVYQCFGLLSVMDASETPIHTIVTGAAMSCGFMMLIAGHKRFGYELSTPMYHQISSGGSGKVADLEENLEQTKKLQKILEEQTCKRTKLSKKQVKQIFAEKKDFYMDAKTALKLGVIDEIIPSIRTFDKPGKQKKLSKKRK